MLMQPRVPRAVTACHGRFHAEAAEPAKTGFNLISSLCELRALGVRSYVTGAANQRTCGTPYAAECLCCR